MGDVRSLIYFAESHDGRIYIGSTDDLARRQSQHAGANRTILALMPGGRDREDFLHRRFRETGADRYRAGCQSEYDQAVLLPYLASLLSHGYATQDEADVDHVPDVMQAAIDPRTIGPSTSVHCMRQATLFEDAPESTAELLRRSVRFACYSSQTDEWYTPPDIIEAARLAMGSIDLDPASCPAANRVVRATHYYSERVDGLSEQHPWTGNVWLNPPYGGQAQFFVARLIREYRATNVPQGIALLNSQAVTTAWCESAIQASDAVAFSRGRWEFEPGNGRVVSSPAGGSMLLYYGQRAKEFREHFDRYAHVMQVLRGPFQ